MGMSTYRYNSSNGDKDILRDKKTRKEYEISKSSRTGETDALLTLLKARTHCNTVGIRLHDSKTIKNLRFNHWGSDDVAFAAACKQFTKMNYTTADTPYDGYFIVKGDLKVEFDALQELNEGASMVQIKNAFMKGNTNRKTSRVIATQMVNIFAA